MSFSATVVADSVSTCTGKPARLTTFSIRYPRMIHAELMTHRIFSRNASSSRAIPVAKQLARIVADPAVPVEWGSNKPGMQAGEALTTEQQALAEDVWARACASAVGFSEEMDKLNVHKQITNRLAEPFAHIAVIVSFTEAANFFSLRHHPMAQPEFQRLAALMADAFRSSSPTTLGANEWHLPYISDAERSSMSVQDCIKASVARCARVSFNNHDGTAPNILKDISLHDTLVVQKPLHASPAEHQATPFFRPVIREFGKSKWLYPYDAKWNKLLGEPDLDDPWSANFRGFFQYRQGLEGQNVTTFPWDAAS